MHSQVEEQLREKMESNNVGVPQTPGSVKDQFDWLFKIQLCKMLGQYDESLKVAAGKIEGLCNELKAKAAGDGAQIIIALYVIAWPRSPRRSDSSDIPTVRQSSDSVR